MTQIKNCNKKSLNFWTLVKITKSKQIEFKDYVKHFAKVKKYWHILTKWQWGK